MSHDEAFELLAPLALDALDADARVEVEAHVETCPECQRELDGLREVATALGNTVEAPPEELWAKIAGRLYDVPRGDEAALPPLLAAYPVREGRRVRRVVRRARVVRGDDAARRRGRDSRARDQSLEREQSRDESPAGARHECRPSRIDNARAIDS